MKICKLPTLSAPLSTPQIEALSANEAALLLSRRLKSLWAIVSASSGNGALIDAAAEHYMSHKGALLNLLAAVDDDIHDLVDRSRDSVRPTVADIVDHVLGRAA
jgi:hypothetical protein